MYTNINRIENLELHPHQVRRIANYKPGTKIICEQGVLWLTLSGKSKDYILYPGEQFAEKKSGMVLIEAIDDAVFSIN